MSTTDRPQPISFVPTAFFAEFLASAREGFDSQLHYEVGRLVATTDAERESRSQAGKATAS